MKIVIRYLAMEYRLKDRMEQCGYTASDIAYITGYSSKIIYSMLHGEYVSESVATSVSKCLGCDVGCIFDYDYMN